MHYASNAQRAFRGEWNEPACTFVDDDDEDTAVYERAQPRTELCGTECPNTLMFRSMLHEPSATDAVEEQFFAEADELDRANEANETEPSTQEQAFAEGETEMDDSDDFVVTASVTRRQRVVRSSACAVLAMMAAGMLFAVSEPTARAAMTHWITFSRSQELPNGVEQEAPPEDARLARDLNRQ